MFSPSASKIQIIFYIILCASLIDIMNGESNFKEVIDRKRQVGPVYLSQEEMREISKVLRFINRRRSVRKKKSLIDKENMENKQKLLMELDEVQHVLEKRLASMVVPSESFKKIRNRGRRKRKTKREHHLKADIGVMKLPNQVFPLLAGSYDVVSQQEGQEKEEKQKIPKDMKEDDDDDLEKWNDTDTRSILGKIYTDLTDLKRMNTAICTKARCKLNGTWESEKAGVLFHLKECREPYDVKLEVDCVKRYSRRKILNSNWKCLGITPFDNLSVLILICINKCKQQTAVFIGQCKICDGIEAIAGNWLLMEKARDCKHLVAAEQVVGDVMRRNIRLANFQQFKHAHSIDKSENGYQTMVDTNRIESIFEK